MGQKNNKVNKVQFDEYKNEVYHRIKDTELPSIIVTKNWELSNLFLK